MAVTPCTLIRGLVLFVAGEAISLYDWATRNNREAKFARFQEEQRARMLWTDGTN